MKKTKLILTCEHAVNKVPQPYQILFFPFKDLLATHRGVDFGALKIALHLQKVFHCAFFQAEVSRMLIDCNRSLDHPDCFSEVTRLLGAKEQRQLIDQYYTPYRERVITLMTEYIKQGFQILHLSIHSFTPMMNGEERTADIGLLYDPQRPLEKEFCTRWQKEMQKTFKVKKNYPYKGTSDGFTTFLRKQFSKTQYLGIEVESNQALTLNEQSIDILKNLLSNSLLKIM